MFVLLSSLEDVWTFVIYENEIDTWIYIKKQNIMITGYQTGTSEAIFHKDSQINKQDVQNI